MSDVTLEELASLAKRRGFIYQGSEIYGGLAGTWDYGPLGVQLKRNISNLWWKMFVEDRADMYGLDTAIIMNPKVWQASGHVDTFNDPLIEDVKTKKRYRLDHLLEDAGFENVVSMSLEEMQQLIKEKGIKSPDGNELGAAGQFNLMFQTRIGADEEGTAAVYLRPETAQGMFVNFKNVVDSFYPDLLFGLAQVGRNFRNEISPRDFIFRVREFEIMEFEWFIEPSTWEIEFERWHKAFYEWTDALGLPKEKIHELEVPEADRAHYSKRTIDFEFEYPFGTKEVAGLAYRTDFDLTNHERESGKNLKYTPKAGGKPFVPHVIEPTFGLDRFVLAVLANAYSVDEMNGEKRVFLKLPKHLAPTKAAVSPLLKNKPELVAKAQEVYQMLQKELGMVTWDDNGNVGKRYRRSDEIGVPAHVTIDFQTLEDSTVTIRDRDTAEQTRVTIQDIAPYMARK
jgi:glycyl-tRNA synthetase